MGLLSLPDCVPVAKLFWGLDGLMQVTCFPQGIACSKPLVILSIICYLLLLLLLLLLLSRLVVSDSVRPHRRQLTRLPRPWDSPGKNTGVGCRFLLQCMKVKSESEVAQLCPTLSDPMDYSPQAPLSVEVSRLNTSKYIIY